MKLGRWIILASTILGFALSAQVARAQTQDQDRRKRAAALYKEAVAANKNGLHEEACNAAEEATQLAPDVSGPWIQLAKCSRKLKRFVQADSACQRALSILDEKSSGDYGSGLRKNIQACRDLRERVAIMIATVELTPPANVDPSNLVIKVNGTVIAAGTLSQPIRVNPGPSTIEVSAPGYNQAIKKIFLEPGETTPVPLPDLLPVVVPTPPEPMLEPAPDPDNSPWRNRAWIATGVSAAAITGMAITGSIALAQNSDDVALVADVFLGVGLASGAVAGYFWWRTANDEPPESNTRTTVLPVVSPGTIGFAVGGHY